MREEKPNQQPSVDPWAELQLSNSPNHQSWKGIISSQSYHLDD